MEAGRRSINDIFNGSRALQIPFFQRSYVWKESQWERFLEDMEMISENNHPHFLGSVILKQQQTPTDGNAGDIRTVIDGQQRLTTLNLFFKVLCLKTDLNGSFNRVFRLMNDTVALDHNRNDREVFEQILDLTELNDISGESNIVEAYRYFVDHINTETIDFSRVLNNIMFVGIDLGNEEDEQQIFDTINSLGVRLTTAELLKNYFFNKQNIQQFVETWESVFEPDEETKRFWDRELIIGRMRRNNIDVFFHAFLQIKLQNNDLNITTVDKKRMSKVEGLFDSYKHFIGKFYNNDKSKLLGEIKEYALLYKDNIDYDVIDRDLSPDYGIDRINAIIFGLDNSTLIPYVLYVLKEVSSLDQRNGIFKYLESYIMRRIINKDSNKNYNRLFSGSLISNKISNRTSLVELIEKKADKTDAMPADEEIKRSFNDNSLINRQTAGILYLIESRIRNRAVHSTALLGMNRYSLEHLMPKKWENHWNGIQTEEAKQIRNKKLLTLGNLTIITASLNSSIRDADWTTKKAGRNNSHGLVHYASGIELISSYLEYEEWNEEKIEERAQFLYEKAIQVWPSE